MVLDPRKTKLHKRLLDKTLKSIDETKTLFEAIKQEFGGAHVEEIEKDDLMELAVAENRPKESWYGKKIPRPEDERVKGLKLMKPSIEVRHALMMATKNEDMPVKEQVQERRMKITGASYWFGRKPPRTPSLMEVYLWTTRPGDGFVGEKEVLAAAELCRIAVRKTTKIWKGILNNTFVGLQTDAVDREHLPNKRHLMLKAFYSVIEIATMSIPEICVEMMIMANASCMIDRYGHAKHNWEPSIYDAVAMRTSLILNHIMAFLRCRDWRQFVIANSNVVPGQHMVKEPGSFGGYEIKWKRTIEWTAVINFAIKYGPRQRELVRDMARGMMEPIDLMEGIRVLKLDAGMADPMHTNQIRSLELYSRFGKSRLDFDDYALQLDATEDQQGNWIVGNLHPLDMESWGSEEFLNPAISLRSIRHVFDDAEDDDEQPEAPSWVTDAEVTVQQRSYPCYLVGGPQQNREKALYNYLYDTSTEHRVTPYQNLARATLRLNECMKRTVCTNCTRQSSVYIERTSQRNPQERPLERDRKHCISQRRPGGGETAIRERLERTDAPTTITRRRVNQGKAAQLQYLQEYTRPHVADSTDTSSDGRDSTPDRQYPDSEIERAVESTDGYLLGFGFNPQQPTLQEIIDWLSMIVKVNGKVIRRIGLRNLKWMAFDRMTKKPWWRRKNGSLCHPLIFPVAETTDGFLFMVGLKGPRCDCCGTSLEGATHWTEIDEYTMGGLEHNGYAIYSNLTETQTTLAPKRGRKKGITTHYYMKRTRAKITRNPKVVFPTRSAVRIHEECRQLYDRTDETSEKRIPTALDLLRSDEAEEASDATRLKDEMLREIEAEWPWTYERRGKQWCPHCEGDANSVPCRFPECYWYMTHQDEAYNAILTDRNEYLGNVTNLRDTIGIHPIPIPNGIKRDVSWNQMREDTLKLIYEVHAIIIKNVTVVPKIPLPEVHTREDGSQSIFETNIDAPPGTDNSWKAFPEPWKTEWEGEHLRRTYYHALTDIPELYKYERGEGNEGEWCSACGDVIELKEQGKECDCLDHRFCFHKRCMGEHHNLIMKQRLKDPFYVGEGAPPEGWESPTTLPAKEALRLDLVKSTEAVETLLEQRRIRYYFERRQHEKDQRNIQDRTFYQRKWVDKKKVRMQSIKDACDTGSSAVRYAHSIRYDPTKTIRCWERLIARLVQQQTFEEMGFYGEHAIYRWSMALVMYIVAKRQRRSFIWTGIKNNKGEHDDQVAWMTLKHDWPNGNLPMVLEATQPILSVYDKVVKFWNDDEGSYQYYHQNVKHAAWLPDISEIEDVHETRLNVVQTQVKKRCRWKEKRQYAGDWL